VPQLPQHSSVKPKGVKPAWEGLTSPGRDSLGGGCCPRGLPPQPPGPSRASFGDVLVAGELLEEAWAHIAVRSPLGHRPGAGPKRSGARPVLLGGCLRRLRRRRVECDATPASRGHRFDRPDER